MVKTRMLFKLALLRAKTDRELLTIINRDLESGLQLVTVTSRHEISERSRDRAEKAHIEATRLLPKVYSLSEREWREVETKLGQLRNAIDRYSCGSECELLAAVF